MSDELKPDELLKRYKEAHEMLLDGWHETIKENIALRARLEMAKAALECIANTKPMKKGDQIYILVGIALEALQKLEEK